jgi:hypothetical protein
MTCVGCGQRRGASFDGVWNGAQIREMKKYRKPPHIVQILWETARCCPTAPKRADCTAPPITSM